MIIQKWKRKKEKALSEAKLEDVYIACNELAQLYYNEEKYAKALEEYKEAEEVAEAMGNAIDVAVANRMIGQVYSSMQEHVLAVNHQFKYLEIARQENNQVEEQRALATLGQTYILKADAYTTKCAEKSEALLLAEKYCLKSLEVCEKLTNVHRTEHMSMRARLFLNLGVIMDEMNEPERAEDYLIEAINVCKAADLWETLYRAYLSVGTLYHRQKKHSLALHSYDEGYEVALRFPEKNDLCCDILLLKGDALFDLPDFRGARQTFLKAYKLNSAAHAEAERKLRTVAAVCCYEEELLQTSNNDLKRLKELYEAMGDGCSAMKNFSKAIEYYDLMLKTAERLGESGDKLRPCYISLSQTYKDNKQYDLAIEYFNKELEVCSNNAAEVCQTMLNIAEILEMKDASADEILSAYEKAWDLAKQAADVKLERSTLRFLVRLCKDHKLPKEELYENELRTLEKRKDLLELSDMESEDEVNTPEIGADICLDNLTDDEDDKKNEENVRSKKRKRTLHIKRNEKGETPLHTACINGNYKLAKKLLDQGHPVDIRDNSGWLPLHEACNFGHTEIVKLLLQCGAAVNDRGTAACGGITPLLDAACCGNLDVMEILLEHGASPLMRTNKGETVLDCLTAWRARYRQEEQRDLNPSILSHYNDLVRQLRSAIEKAGQKPVSCQKQKEDVVPPSSSSLCQNENRLVKKHYSFPPSLSTDSSRLTGNDSLRKSLDTCVKRREMNDRWNDKIAQGAASEYKNTIKALRHRNTAPVHKMSLPKSEDHTALVSPEVVWEDWLIDDLESGQTKGTKKSCTRQPLMRSGPCFQPASPSGSNSSESSSESTVLVSPVNRVPTILESEDSSDFEITKFTAANNADQQPLLSATTISQVTSPDKEPTVNKLQLNRGIRRKQLSLFATGIKRHVESRHTEVINTSASCREQQEYSCASSSHVSVTNSCTTTSNNDKVTPTTTVTSHLVPCQSLKVRIEDKLFLVPLPSSPDQPLTVAWLAKEAARRYQSVQGIEPQLSLSTQDGALLAPDDPVSLFISGSEVHATVLAWNLAPLTERYKEACNALNTEIDDFIEWSLDGCQATSSLCLEDLALLPTQLAPAFKALMHHYALQHIILPGNQLGDEGVQMLSEFVIKLPQLRELNLSCNNITVDGVSLLAQKAIQCRGLQRLEVLDLSTNPLGEDCLRALGQLLSCTSVLNTLNLASVGLVGRSFRSCFDLSLDSIEKLDIGYNELGREGCVELLSKLEPSRLIELKMTATGKNIVREVALFLEQRDPYNLISLDLAYCSADDNDITQLIRSLQRAVHLQNLNLSGNPIESTATVCQLQQLPLKVLSLYGVEVVVPPEPHPLMEFSCLSLNPPSWAKQGPFGLVTTSNTH